mmetsp:Transcript_17327/g.44015  ORF Transcript_17327/g.44015 Transcript_17327/m.44015 type:complete len:229 (+) Transcript_17327:347-1033(+)
MVGHGRAGAGTRGLDVEWAEAVDRQRHICRRHSCMGAEYGHRRSQCIPGGQGHARADGHKDREQDCAALCAKRRHCSARLLCAGLGQAARRGILCGHCQGAADVAGIGVMDARGHRAGRVRHGAPLPIAAPAVWAPAGRTRHQPGEAHAHAGRTAGQLLARPPSQPAAGAGEAHCRQGGAGQGMGVAAVPGGGCPRAGAARRQRRRDRLPHCQGVLRPGGHLHVRGHL